MTFPFNKGESLENQKCQESSWTESQSKSWRSTYITMKSAQTGQVYLEKRSLQSAVFCSYQNSRPCSIQNKSCLYIQTQMSLPVFFLGERKGKFFLPANTFLKNKRTKRPMNAYQVFLKKNKNIKKNHCLSPSNIRRNISTGTHLSYSHLLMTEEYTDRCSPIWMEHTCHYLHSQVNYAQHADVAVNTSSSSQYFDRACV